METSGFVGAGEAGEFGVVGDWRVEVVCSGLEGGLMLLSMANVRDNILGILKYRFIERRRSVNTKDNEEI